MSAAPIGHNSPPPDPFEAFTTTLGDDLLEAHNWADSTAIETQAQADELSFLIDRLRKDAKAADEARAEEKKPHDDAAKAVQAKWKPLLDRADKAVAALKATLGVFLRAQEAAKQEAARLAREEAERAQRAAAEAARAASATDLAAQEEADALMRQAEDLTKGAQRAERSKAQATGGTRAMGLRTVWRVELADELEAVRTMWRMHKEEMVAYALQLAQRDVREGKRTLAGFTVTEDRVAA